MAEKRLRKYIIQGFKKIGVTDINSVENLVAPGTPDINGCFDGVEFWIELKHIPAWPKRASTKIKIDHFTQQQKLWLRRRCKSGGQAYLLIQCQRDWILVWGEKAWNLGLWNFFELQENALGTFSNFINFHELLSLILTKKNL